MENVKAVLLKPIFTGLDEAAQKIINDALAEAREIISKVEALREKHRVENAGPGLESTIEEAVQVADIEELRAHDSALRDIITVIIDILQAEETAHTRSIEAYRDLFQTLPTPGIAYTFQGDDEFARLRVAGPNPMLIRGIDRIPDNFPVTPAQYSAVMGGDKLADALADGRVYLCDYKELELSLIHI